MFNNDIRFLLTRPKFSCRNNHFYRWFKTRFRRALGDDNDDYDDEDDKNDKNDDDDDDED
jgi:hypothetical protein